MMRYELTDAQGRSLNLLTDSGSVLMRGGGTLADKETVYPLVTISHGLGFYPFVMLCRAGEGESASLFPSSAVHTDKNTLTVYTAARWDGKPILEKQNDQEYTVRFENAVLYIRLL